MRYIVLHWSVVWSVLLFLGWWGVLEWWVLLWLRVKDCLVVHLLVIVEDVAVVANKVPRCIVWGGALVGELELSFLVVWIHHYLLGSGTCLILDFFGWGFFVISAMHLAPSLLHVVERMVLSWQRQCGFVFFRQFVSGCFVWSESTAAVGSPVLAIAVIARVYSIVGAAVCTFGAGWVDSRSLVVVAVAVGFACSHFVALRLPVCLECCLVHVQGPSVLLLCLKFREVLHLDWCPLIVCLAMRVLAGS
jgi:hypothetical protein